MEEIDLFIWLYCVDCKKNFQVSGSAALPAIHCPTCKGKNWATLQEAKQFIYPFKPNDK